MRRQKALRIAQVVGFALSACVLGCGLAVYGCGEGSDMAIVDVEPKQGPTTGEQPVKILGQNFRTDVGYTIYFGTKRAENVTILDDQTLLVMTPSREEAGPVDINIVADNGPAFVIRQAFSYQEASGVDPGTGGPTKSTKLNF